MTTAAKLTAAQQTNLDRLAAVGGTYTWTWATELVAPRRGMRYRFEIKQGYRSIRSEKTSSKGFHRTALESLRDMGLVDLSVHYATEGTKGKIGYRRSGAYTFTLTAKRAS